MTSSPAAAVARLRHAPGLITHSRLVLRRWACFGVLLLLATVSRAGPAPMRIVPGLEEPLVAMGPTSRSEDAALEAALARFDQPSKPPNDFADAARPLTAFLADHPRSPWRMALLTDLGLGYYHAGYFSKATAAWSQAWQLGRGATQPQVKALADRAAGELARMHARLGHAAELDALFSDMGDRAVGGPATEMIAGAREGLWSFRNDYGTAYLCGPMALRNLLASLKADPAKIEVLNAQRSGPQGFSLDQVSRLAGKVGLAHRLVRRTASQAIPVPSVVHWKLNHYAAIVAEKNGRYHVQDPTFASGDAWLTRAAIDEESSGYFLVPGMASADASWRTASVDEARRVHGMGQTSNNEPGNTMPASKGLYPVSCDRMCEVNAKTMLVSLSLNDTPVGYTPPKGAAEKRSFDAVDRLTAVESALGRFDYRYVGASDRVSAIAAGDGPQVAMRYFGSEGDEMLKQIAYTSAAGAPLATYAYTYDANHNVQSFADALPGEKLAALSPMRAGDAGGSGMSAPVLQWVASASVPAAVAALFIAFAVSVRRATTQRSVSIGIPLVALALMVSCGGGGSGGFIGGVNWGGAANSGDGATGSPGSAEGSAATNGSGTGSGPGATGGAGSDGGAGGVVPPPPNPSARLTRYGYDDTDRLTTASTALNVPGAPILSSYAYGYDKASNLISVNGNGIVRNLEVTATNALSAGTYDANGNPLKLGAAKYEWDAANRLVGHAVNNTDSTFVYDGQSRLVRIIDRQEGAVVADKSYLWCGLERCLERDNTKAGAPVSKRYFEQGVVQDGVAYRYVADPLGSVRQLVDAGGRSRARYDYEPYGARNKVDGDVDADVGFAGLFAHRPSGLALAVYRGYDPQRGRWLNRDPMGEAGGLNRYTYVDASPLNFTDRLGLAAEFRQPRDMQLLEGGGGGGGLPAPIGGGTSSAGGDGMGRVGGVGRGGGSGGGSINEVPNSASVCRGGACTAESFAHGSGLSRAADGTLTGVSTQCKPGATVEELAAAFKHNQVGVTTVGEIRASGGRLTLDGNPGSPNHATVDGLTPAQFEQLFRPTILNPVPPGLRR